VSPCSWSSETSNPDVELGRSLKRKRKTFASSVFRTSHVPGNLISRRAGRVCVPCSTAGEGVVRSGTAAPFSAMKVEAVGVEMRSAAASGITMRPARATAAMRLSVAGAVRLRA